MSFPHRCWAEIDLDALRNNLAWLRHRIGSGNRILTVVKADAYGHGLRQIAALLMQSGTDVFGVANLDEARDIRAVGRGWPILMLGACLPGETDRAIKDNVMPTLSSLEEARRFSKAAKKLNKTVRAQIKVDTGMGRLGVPTSDAPQLIQVATKLPHLEINGLYTHYASAEDNASFSRRQRQAFRQLVQSLDQDLDYLHANNSAALLHEPDSIYNLSPPGPVSVRRTPAGPPPRTGCFEKNLQTALTWKCRVSFLKTISKGTPLSYGQRFTASRKMRVATLTAGYGDGYLSSGSGQARVLIGGKRCAVLGRITMDQMLVDVSCVPGVQCGDEAVLIGSQGRQTITANQLAEWAGTIPWETLTAITHRVPRLYRGGQAA